MYSNSKTILIGIGTLLNCKVPELVPKVVFGTGTGYGTPPVINDSWKIYFLRGPLTASALKLDAALAITDAAIMCSKYFKLPDEKSKQSKIGFMPHWSTAQSQNWEKICDDLGIKYIDPRKKVCEVFGRLAKIDCLLAEAMHGAILADTFRIPWAAVKTHNKILNFKWEDWCRSMNIAYEPIQLPSLWVQKDDFGFVCKMKQGVKAIVGQGALLKAAKFAKFKLSSIDTHNQKIEQIEEQFYKFRKEYAAGVFI